MNSSELHYLIKDLIPRHGTFTNFRADANLWDASFSLIKTQPSAHSYALIYLTFIPSARLHLAQWVVDCPLIDTRLLKDDLCWFTVEPLLAMELGKIRKGENEFLPLISPSVENSIF